LFRREIVSDSGIVLDSVDNSDFKQVEGRMLWLPYKTEERSPWPETGTFPETASGHTCTLKTIDQSPIANEEFVLNYNEPGTSIRDETGNGPAQEHTVPLDKGRLEQATTQAEREVGPTNGETGSSVGWIVMSITSISLAIGAVVYWYVLNRRRS
jgi:hypothetical protein